MLEKEMLAFTTEVMLLSAAPASLILDSTTRNQGRVLAGLRGWLVVRAR